MKKAFTMIELIFVIVVIGILAGVALPRLAANRDDAEITKAKAQVASIRAGIQTKRSANLLSSNDMKNSGYPESLDNGDDLFGNVLSPAIKSSNDNGWSKSGDTYTYKLNGKTATFTYHKDNSTDGKTKAGSFVCSGNEDFCNLLDK